MKVTEPYINIAHPPATVEIDSDIFHGFFKMKTSVMTKIITVIVE